MPWEPAESAAKNAAGEYMGLVGGQWVPVQGAAKDASGKYMVLRDQGTPATRSQEAPASRPFTPSGEKPQPSFASEILDNPRTAEALAGNQLTRIAKGAAAPLLGGAQLIAHLAGGGKSIDETLKQNEDLTRAGAGLEKGDIDPYELGGSVLSPVFLKAAKLIKPGERLLTRMLQGAGFGGAGGLTAPVTDGGDKFVEDKAQQTGVGAAGGALVAPVAAVGSKVAGTVYHGLIEPWANPAAIKGRAYLEAAGDKTKEIIDLLTRNKQIVSGSAPTAGEAAVPANRAEFSALQESAAKAKPSDYLARADEQNAARVDSLKEWAGNPAKRAEAAAAREAAAGPLYRAGTASEMTSIKLPKAPGPAAPPVTEWQLPPDKAGPKVPLQTEMTGFRALAERPSMQAAVKRAEDLVQEETGHRPDLLAKGAKLTGEDAQRIKLAFDDLIKLYPKSAMDTAELKALRETRAVYLEMLESQFPILGGARSVYKAASEPINQMDVGEALVKKLQPALREDAKLRSSVFANAVQDSASTIKRATGEPRFEKLEDVLTSRQLQSVHNVQDDLARSDRHLQMAREGVTAGPAADVLATQNLQKQTGGPLPNMLHRGVMLANAVIARMEGKVNKKLASEMAAEMLNPPGVAKSLAEAQAREARNKMLAEAIYKWQRPVIGGVANQVQTGE